MSIPLHKRTQGCLYLLNHQFDVEATINHVLQECAAEPAMLRSQHQRELARNIVTIGGSGDQQQLNLAAFKDALREFDYDRQSNFLQEHKRELDAVRSELRDAEQRAYATERDYRKLSQEYRQLTERSNTHEGTRPQSEAEKEAVGV